MVCWIQPYCGIKRCSLGADIQYMIISDEQARLAARYARTHNGEPVATSAPDDVSSELIARATAAARSAPDIRSERVEDARVRLDTGELDAHDVATKILSRIVSDSLR